MTEGTTSSPRRGSDDSRPVSPADYPVIVETALAAFASDVSYAVAMARAATSLRAKREATAVRRAAKAAEAAERDRHQVKVMRAQRDLKAAEAHAHAECSRITFQCYATDPCGVGDCKFAPGVFSRLEVLPVPGQSRRPQESNTSRYDLGSALEPLLALRDRIYLY